MEFKRVRSLRDALAVRKIRNEGCSYLTNDQNKISVLGQVNWYYSFFKNQVDYQLYLLMDKVPVGYGAIHKEGKKWYITEVVKEKFRHKGYGTIILFALKEFAKLEESQLIAEIWASNKKSIALHIKHGFKLNGSKMKSGKKINIYYV
jgi:RimJ/RimL family protein N-acetyltransferase